MSDQQRWLTEDAVQAVFDLWQQLRDEVRDRAHAATGDDNLPVRKALLDVAFRLNELDDELRFRIGLPPRVAPEPESAALSSQPPTDWPLVDRQEPTGRPAARHLRSTR